MPKTYKVSTMRTSARRPSTRTGKNRKIKGKLTLTILALAIVFVSIYVLVSFVRTDHTSGSVEVVVGSKLMAYINPEDVLTAVSVDAALEKVAVRPTSMQKVVLMGKDFDMELSADEMQMMHLISTEMQIILTKEDGTVMGELKRIYLPIDEEDDENVA